MKYVLNNGEKFCGFCDRGQREMHPSAKSRSMNCAFQQLFRAFSTVSRTRQLSKNKIAKKRKRELSICPYSTNFLLT